MQYQSFTIYAWRHTKGMTEGSLAIENMESNTRTTGSTPFQLDIGSRTLNVSYCCMGGSGLLPPIDLPTEQPFILLKVDAYGLIRDPWQPCTCSLGHLHRCGCSIGYWPLCGCGFGYWHLCETKIGPAWMLVTIHAQMLMNFSLYRPCLKPTIGIEM